MEYIKIPITQRMKNDYADCQAMVDVGEDKDCSECSLDGGAKFGCMAERRWYREEHRRTKDDMVRKKKLTPE